MTAGFSLIALMMHAPLIGIRLRWPTVLHAIDMDGLPIKTWPHGKARSVCGLSGLRVAGSGETIGLWPPRVSSLPDGWTRCKDCFDATKHKRPRSEFKAAA